MINHIFEIFHVLDWWLQNCVGRKIHVSDLSPHLIPYHDTFGVVQVLFITIGTSKLPGIKDPSQSLQSKQAINSPFYYCDSFHGWFWGVP